MQDLSVKRLFQEQIGEYSQVDRSLNSRIFNHFLSWIKRNKIKGGLSICEFGGGAGQLLAKIGESYPKAQLMNVELVGEYKNHLVSKKIKFIKGSILNSSFPDSSFDVLIIRDILHHLVGRNYKQTFNNQCWALKELKRLLRPGGVIFIDELTNSFELGVKFSYLFSKFNSRLGLRIKLLQITPNAIIVFLTPKKLKRMIKNILGKENNILEYCYNVRVGLGSRLVHFGGSLKRTMIVIEKQ